MKLADQLLHKKTQLRSEIESSLSLMYDIISKSTGKKEFRFSPYIKESGAIITNFDGSFATVNQYQEHFSELGDIEIIKIIAALESKLFEK